MEVKTKPRPLTAQQQKVLDVLEEFWREHGFPPTLREIGELLALPNVNAVRGHVTALEKKGYITKAPEKARSIRLVRVPSAFSELKRKLHEIFRTDEGVLHRLVYGLTWATSGGRPILTGAARRRVEAAIEKEVAEHGWKLLSRRIYPSLVVLVVEVWPNHSPDQTVRRLRRACEAAKQRHRKDFPQRGLWAKGYAATTDLEILDELGKRLLSEQAG